MSPGDSTVLFRALPIHLKISKSDQQSLIVFAGSLASTLANGRSFTCLVTNDRTLRKLNAQFLTHDYATDVLSFPTGHSDDESLGDLAISVERASDQAAEFGHTLLDELRTLMLHGLLHLLGFDHETDSGQMARAERQWRHHFGLPSSLIARARTARPHQQVAS